MRHRYYKDFIEIIKGRPLRDKIYIDENHLKGLFTSYLSKTCCSCIADTIHIDKDIDIIKNK